MEDDLKNVENDLRARGIAFRFGKKYGYRAIYVKNKRKVCVIWVEQGAIYTDVLKRSSRQSFYFHYCPRTVQDWLTKYLFPLGPKK